MKLYTFLNEREEVLEQVRAENHDQAVMAASHPNIAFDTDFYSETIETVEDIKKELESLKRQQQELIELGDFELAHDLEHDITFVKSKLGDKSPEFSHLI